MRTWAIFFGLTISVCLFKITEGQALALLAAAPAVAYGGLATGIIGTVFGSISLKLLLKTLKEEDDEVYYAQPYQQPAYAPQAQSSYAGYRKKRSTGLEIDEGEVDRTLNNAYIKDASRCADKLVCGLAAELGDESHPEYKYVLETILGNKKHGYAYRKMGHSIMAGLYGAKCEKLFPKCSYSLKEMMKTIDLMTSQIAKQN